MCACVFCGCVRPRAGVCCVRGRVCVAVCVRERRCPPSPHPTMCSVTVNYRLGVLGNQYLEAAAAANSSWPTSANYNYVRACMWRWLS